MQLVPRPSHRDGERCRRARRGDRRAAPGVVALSTPVKLRPAIPVLALRPAEAAASVGMGETAFREHVAPHVRVIRRGALRLYPVADLQRWVAENAALTLDPSER